MPYYKKLVGEICYLSPCTPEDAENWAAWFNDLEVTIPLGDEAYTPSTLEREGEMIDEINRNLDHVFTIVDLETEQAIGRCLLFAIDQLNRNGMLGIVIGAKEYWGRGYGQEAIRLLLDYAFNLLNLNSIMLGVLDFNERAIRCYEKVGFKQIGHRRQARIIGDRKCDAVLMDILAEEFESPCVTRLVG
jgi:RimJ/RimL family protein N-acetyltransferase